jgi:hypothetical protein
LVLLCRALPRKITSTLRSDAVLTLFEESRVRVSSAYTALTGKIKVNSKQKMTNGK